MHGRSSRTLGFSCGPCEGGRCIRQTTSHIRGCCGPAMHARRTHPSLSLPIVPIPRPDCCRLKNWSSASPSSMPLSTRRASSPALEASRRELPTLTPHP